MIWQGYLACSWMTPFSFNYVTGLHLHAIQSNAIVYMHARAWHNTQSTTLYWNNNRKTPAGKKRKNKNRLFYFWNKTNLLREDMAEWRKNATQSMVPCTWFYCTVWKLLSKRYFVYLHSIFLNTFWYILTITILNIEILLQNRKIKTLPRISQCYFLLARSRLRSGVP